MKIENIWEWCDDSHKDAGVCILRLSGKRDGKELIHYWKSPIYPELIEEWKKALAVAKWTDIEVRVIDESEVA